MANDSTIACNSGCGSKFRPTGTSPVPEQLRAAGWRHFDGQTQGGQPWQDVRCPDCSKPDPVALKLARELEREVR